MSKGGQIAIAVLSVFAAFAWIFSSSEGTFRSFDTVTEMRDELQRLAAGSGSSQAQQLRVGGFVVEGSIRKQLDAEQVWFAIHDAPPAGEMKPDMESGTFEDARPVDDVLSVEGALPVLYAGIDLPDLFRDGAQVVVEGRMAAGTFEATRIMAKCPSKYENAPEYVPADETPARVADLGTDR